tara:strand:+ start:1075 stop:1338 length:264 start_codon:yes stop_codon:yes gene_type:complete
MSKEAVVALCELSPMLKKWIAPQVSDAIKRDFIEFADEPHAMIGIFIMEQSIAGFAEVIIETAKMEVFNMIMEKLMTASSDFVKEWI